MMWLIMLFGLLSPTISIELNEEKPLLQEISLPKNLKENQSIRLNCALLLGQSVKFEWMFNGEKVIENEKRKLVYHEDSSDLIIKTLSVDELGEIKCIATNKYGQDVQKVQLLINGKFKI